MNIQNNSAEDKELVIAAKQNPDAFQAIVDRYWNRLFFYIRRMSYFTQEDIEDILQEVFIKIYKYLNDYDDNMAFSTWVYQITRNATIDEIRKRKARPTTVWLEDEDLLKVMKSSFNLEKEYITKESIDKLKNIITEMPDKYREVLILRFIEEKTYEEIMDIVQLPKGTIASLVNRGRKIILEEAKNKKII
ncbi:MAG: sigma-70 family RNA polymerase sigma factor [Bacteroidales bacterium]|jgi:RNA polymerase sigma-70 factor (ECF subfamily)|nr:sigma-70 family RNA polymerase sigma factor [Bacteroidales bacterium]